MSRATCPCCGQTIKAPRAVAAVAPVSTADMTDAQLYAHYKRTGPTEDVRFFSRLMSLSDTLRSDVLALLDDAPGLARAAVLGRLTILQGIWRRDTNNAARRLPEVIAPSGRRQGPRERARRLAGMSA